MKSEDFSCSSARHRFTKVEKLHTQPAQERFNLTLEQRDLLGPERYIKLLEVKYRLMEKRRDLQGPGM